MQRSSQSRIAVRPFINRLRHVKPRGFAPLRMMLRGLVDGLRQVSGPLR